jgi:hypothetical protein
MSDPKPGPPPRWADRLLERLCAPEKREEVLGDLHERYYRRAARLGQKHARRRYPREVLAYLRLAGIKRKTNLYPPYPPYFSMYEHNLRLTYRTFLRSKGSFFINLIGLSAGLACALLICLWVRDELRVDAFFAHGDRLVQVLQNVSGPQGTETMPATPGPLAPALAADMPEVAHAVTVVPTLYNSSKGIASAGTDRFKATCQYATPDFFRVFSYELLAGRPDRVLTDKHGATISPDLARKLFGTAEGVTGRAFRWQVMDIEETLFVTGVFAPPPGSATVQFDLVIPFELFKAHRPGGDQWGANGPHTYVLLREGASPAAFNAKIAGLLKARHPEAQGTLWAQRYQDRYLHGNYENGAPAGGRIAYVRLFALVALFTLTIAAINFTNLSTARASRRLKEVGIKKAVGAGRSTLIGQYLGESLLMAFLSLGLALALVVLLLPAFNNLTGKALIFGFDLPLVGVMLAVTAGTGLLAGSYPAFYLSGFHPVGILKGSMPRTSAGERWARRGLVVFQYVLSVLLIVAVGVVYAQLRYVQAKNLGYSRDHVVYFKTENPGDALLEALRRTPGVAGAGGFFHDLTRGGDHGVVTDVSWPGKNPQDQLPFTGLHVGYGFTETLGMRMAAGRTFSAAFGAAEQVIFNEAAVARMGLRDPVGKTVTVQGAPRQIVGVVKNFHFQSLHEPVTPCFLLLNPTEYLPKVMVKIGAGDPAATLARLREVYQTYHPGLAFDYQFLDADYQRLYAAEQRVAGLARYFAGLAILISCLGLLGLAAFTAERRRKEIGVRKVLGATEWGIVWLLSGDLARLVGVAVLLALPPGYLLARQWLAGFAYRIDLQPWYFLAAGGLALATALLTVGLQAARAARANPVESLKEE